jgi:predicted Zn-dependent protease
MRKFIIITVSCCTVLLLLGYTGYRGYQVWKEKHWMSMAQEFLAKSDGRNAHLCLQQVLRFNYKNLEATRLMANLTEASRSSSALLWRERVLELNPDSLDDRLALIKTALVFGNYAVATNALADVPAADQNNASFQNLAGTVAIATGQRTAAEQYFSTAARIEPWNSAPVLNLSVVRLHGTNSLDMAEARLALKRVSLTSTNLDQRCLALRELVADAARFKQLEDALSYSQELLRQTNSIFRDRLLHLEVLREAKPTEFKSTLTAFQHAAVTNDANIFELARWQMARMSPTAAFDWLKTLPLETQTNQPVTALMADCRVLLQDWSGLQQTLEKQNWAELEFMRHAFLSRALRSLAMDATSKAAWTQALEASGNNKARLTLLLQFAAQAKWLSEAEEILWRIVNQFPDDQLAARTLTQALYENGRTRPLLNLFALQAKRKPADLGIKNNLAMTALLLDSPELKPHDLAREIYQKAPTNAAYSSTYAFSLHLQKQDTEALQVMQQLPPSALEDPSIAGYYGLILKATGDRTKAAAYLNWAFKSTLLPEEKKLFETARAGL